MTSIEIQKKISSLKLRTGIVLITATMINSYSYSEMIIGSIERMMTILFVVFGVFKTSNKKFVKFLE